MPVKPPADIHLVCTVDQFESETWTEAWNHQVDVHAGDTVPWNLAGTA